MEKIRPLIQLLNSPTSLKKEREEQCQKTFSPPLGRSSFFCLRELRTCSVTAASSLVVSSIVVSFFLMRVICRLGDNSGVLDLSRKDRRDGVLGGDTVFKLSETMPSLVIDDRVNGRPGEAGTDSVESAEDARSRANELLVALRMGYSPSSASGLPPSLLFSLCLLLRLGEGLGRTRVSSGVFERRFERLTGVTGSTLMGRSSGVFDRDRKFLLGDDGTNASSSCRAPEVAASGSTMSMPLSKLPDTGLSEAALTVTVVGIVLTGVVCRVERRDGESEALTSGTSISPELSVWIVS